MVRRAEIPEHALIVTQYSELRLFTRAFADGHHQLLTVVGSPGLGKSEELTRAMRNALGCKWTLIKGKHTSLDLYRKLYESRLYPIVLDDLDGLFKSPDNTALLKCVCDTRLVKQVEWGSTHADFRRVTNALPNAFESISNVAVIVNDWQTLNRNLAALQDRGVLIIFRPNALEVHQEVSQGGWFDDSEVFDFFGRHLYLITTPSFRLYITAKNNKKAGMDWQGLFLRTIESSAEPGLILVARLLADPMYDAQPAPEAARIEAFEKLGGGSRATYYRHKKELLNRRNHQEFTTAIEMVLQDPRLDPTELAIKDRRKYLEAMRDEIDVPAKQEVAVPTQASVDDPPQSTPKDQLTQLSRELKQAIAIEDYERAAKLRDAINRLQSN